MKPEHRFHSYVTGATVTVMYFVIQYLIPAIHLHAAIAPYLNPIATILLSVGTYKLLATMLLGTARKVAFVKRHLLGASYLNGTWIGKFSTADASLIYTVEHFEQTLSSLKIRGKAYTQEDKLYAQWNSLAETIDVSSGVLTYTYNCDKSNTKVTLQGVCVFHFERINESGPPSTIRGYSAELLDGDRTENTETKISEKLVPFDEALRRAKA